MIRQYGGKVTTAPSKKTSYVLLGEDAGPKKLRCIIDHGLNTIDAETLFELIRRLPGKALDVEPQQREETSAIAQANDDLDGAKDSSGAAAQRALHYLCN